METTKTDTGVARVHEDGIPPPLGAPADATEAQSQIASLPEVLPGEAVAALKAHPTMAQKVVAAIERGLEAKAMFYSKGQKEWIAEIDHKTQLAAAKLYIENVEGLPIQRVHTITEDRSADPKALLLKSPAARRAYRKMLDDADREAAELEAVQKPGGQKQVGPASEPPAG
jgi:hypothetical protein